MGFKDFLKKFGQIALAEAPAVLKAANLPPEMATAVSIGVTAGKAMVGADNPTRAKEAAIIAKDILSATNAVLVSRGHAPLVDTTVTDDMFDHAVKITYDATKLKAGV